MTGLKAADIFLAAFKNCVENIIKALPPNASPSDTITANAIRIIGTQLNGDFMRLQYVIEVVQARICEDPAWASGTAVTVYELLAASIDPNFSHPSIEMSAIKGAILVRDQMVRAGQMQFQHTMTAEAGWNRGLVAFLGQQCTVGSITSTTPRIALHFLDCMLTSGSLENNSDNFDVFLGFVMCAGPFLDSFAGFKEQLTVRMQKLQECAKALRTTHWLAVYGLLQLREKGW
ncbi:hypothetical protein BDW02DRAFT_638511 [Decorospora gaudefroyi]|uniref:Uncharacterized protein n=1 Tax=Decorospora gaudefroyi TaxID=184978 RepID=A0A6A5KIB9_9PLEO|nr:hypothetical protein BDW02DRAFT_638511 [Decorospora gaudefroyi]